MNKILPLFALIFVLSNYPLYAQTKASKKSSSSKRQTKSEDSSTANATAEEKESASEDNSPVRRSGEQGPPFSLTANSSAGSNSYYALTLNGRLRLLPQAVLLGSASFSSYDGLKSQAYSLGIQSQVTRELRITLTGRYLLEPNELQGLGFGLRGDYLLSSLWGGQFLTEVFGEFEWTRYSQKRTAPFNRFFLSEAIQQYALTAGLYQQLTGFLDASVSFTQYIYSDDSQKLALAVENRSIQNPHFAGLIQGFPKYGWNFNLGIHPAQIVDLGAFYSWTKLVLDKRSSSTLGGIISFSIAPTLYLNALASRTLVQDQTPNWVYGIGLSAKL